ncbi:MAG TPA: BACON domain-containing carbohydrate-binding protein [Paludibacter sp.]
MKHVFTYLFSVFLLGSTFSVYSQKPTQKDIYGQEIINTVGKKINYSESDLKLLKSVAVNKMPQLSSSFATQSTILKTPINAKIENLYSIMGTSIGRNSMHSLDIDKDGNIELICTATTQGFGIANFWYIMRYNSTDKTWSQVWTSTQYATNITTLEIVDFNNDGNYNIMLGFTNGTIEVYDAVTKELIKSVSPVTESINSIVYADADNDLQKDIVISCPSNTYIIDATTLAKKYTINKGANYVRVGKLDDSNKNEIVLSSGFIYKLDGSTLSTVWNYNTTGEGYVELSDIDSDSKQEVVFAQSWYYIYVYDVDTKTTKYSIKSDLDINALLLTDVNNDGVDEILYGDGQWGNIYCHNSVTQALIWTVPNPEHGVSAINYADVNNDGKKELIWAAGWTSTGSDYLYIYNVPDNKLLWRSDDIVGPFYAVASGDVDDDGKDEIVAVSYESESGYDSGILLIIDAQTNKLKWKCDGNFLYGAWQGLYNVSISDIDNDGKNEIIVAADQTYTGKIWIVDGKNHTIKSSHLFSTENVGELHSLEVNDIDGDGQKELIAASSSTLYVINPTDWSIKWNVSLSSTYSNPIIKCSDINGDAKKEIIVCKGAIQIINSTDHSYWTSPESNYTNIDLFDFNNDGILDIVASTSNGHIVVIDGNSKSKLSDVNPEIGSIVSVRTYKNNNSFFYIYSCNGQINFYQNDTNCNASQYLGTNIGGVESLKLYNNQASSTEILIGTPTSVLKMYFNVMSVSSNNLTIASSDNSKTTFDITTAKNWTISNNQNWLTTSSSTGSGNTTITLTAQANVSGEKRSTTLTISDTGSNSQVITVTQDGAAPVLTVSTDSLTIGALQGSTKSLDIMSNMNWTAASNQNWLTVSSLSGSGNLTLKLTANSNPTITTRTSTVTISVTGLSPQIITVIQNAGAAALSVSSNYINIAAPANSTKTFVIYSNINWTVSSDQFWLTVNTHNGSNSATITLLAQASQTTVTRSAIVTVSGTGVATQTITVTQDPGVPALTVSSSTLTISVNNIATFDILSNTNWTVTSNQFWLTPNTNSGIGNTSITLSAQPNSTSKTRAASLIISGVGVSPQAITVLQEVASGINEIDESFLAIFPNPSTSKITINNISKDASISIYDLSGKMVISRIATSTIEKIDVSNLDNGVYTIKVTNNLTTKTRKFIKQ